MCDSLFVGSSRSACGYNIFAKASDRSPNEPQPLVFVPAADHAPRPLDDAQLTSRMVNTYKEIMQMQV